MFRRRSSQLVEETEPATEVTDEVTEEVTEEVEEADEDPSARRGYTPSKKERGISTPKRPHAHLRRPGTVPTSASGKKLTKEERQELKEERRRRRQEVTEGMKRGDERYLTARDKGPERKIARDVVDSRRTVGTWFFAGALFVLLFSGAAMPDEVRLIANLAWAVLAIAVITDSWLLCRKTKRLVRQRHPDSTERMGALYFYVIMRALTFRKLRIPHPGRRIGEKI
nr:DUF3043 domain-containing protein [Natronosporangium hydrolyticum]